MALDGQPHLAGLHSTSWITQRPERTGRAIVATRAWYRASAAALLPACTVPTILLLVFGALAGPILAKHMKSDAWAEAVLQPQEHDEMSARHGLALLGLW